MAAEDDPVYCLCRMPYDETRFMIECDVCKDWFHGGCVNIQEHQAADIEIYHCPNCAPKHGPLVLKNRRNWHRHDYSEDGSKIKSAVQTGTVVFIKELKSRSFPSADEIPIKRLHGSQVTAQYFEEEGFDVPILCEKKDGLGLTLPPPSISIQEIEQLVGSMREIDVIDVARQDDIKMPMREWTEYYKSPNRDKILNVISLEFSGTKLTEHVTPPSIIRQVSWARNVWPEQLPEDSTLVRPEVQKYCLMGVKDSFTDFHIDFGGTSVWYHVLRGEKVFYLIRPTQTNLMLYERWLSSSNQSEMFFGEQVDHCYRMVVKQGHTLFIPTGWIHAVFTPIDSLVFGGNFLHNYNIPLQLQCYEIERSVKTPEKYLFPSYETMNWYAAKSLLDILKDYTEEGKRPPEYFVAGARALSVSLKSWTQRKDLTSKFVYAKVGKQDAADYIQYGKVLKELQKEVKKIDNLRQSPKKRDQPKCKNPSPKKQEAKKKAPKGSKKVKGLDVLDQHTKESLKSVGAANEHQTVDKAKLAADREQRENIYNFEDEEEDISVSLKVRIPKAGAYIAEGEESSKYTGKELKIEGKSHSDKKLRLEETKEVPVKNSNSNLSKKAKTKKDKDKVEPLESKKSETHSAIKEIPQCLKFKLSNGKMVSTDRKKKSKKLNLKQFLLLGPESTSVPETPSDSKDNEKIVKESKTKLLKSSPEKLKCIKTEDNSSKKQETSSKKSDKMKSPTTKEKIKSEKKAKRKGSEQKKKSKIKEKNLPEIADQDSDSDHLVVDERPKKPPTQKTTSATKPASLKRKLPLESLSTDHSPAGDSSKVDMDSIRGGLNGSISDILTASGYGGDADFKVDTSTSGMRDAIAGMLTMSRMGNGANTTSPQVKLEGKENKKETVDEEEQLMADCYQDSEFVYPSFDLSDDDEESIYKSRKKSEKDDNWNPKGW